MATIQEVEALKKKNKLDLEKAKGGLTEKERLELASSRAGGVDLTMNKGIIETPQETAVRKGIENAKINELIKEGLKTPVSQENIGLAKQVGEMPTPSFANDEIVQQPSPSKLDIGQALGAAGRAFIPGAIGGATLGAIGGAAATGPLAPLGAVAGGAIVGTISGTGAAITAFINNIKKQRKEDITASAAGIKKRTTNMFAYVTDVNQGGNSQEDLERFNLELAGLDNDYSQLKLDTQSKFLGEDGTAEMASYKIFNEPGGTRERLIYEMQQAILNPNPSKSLLSFEDISEE